MRRTVLWAIAEGFAPEDAERIGRADVEFDSRYPARASLVNITRHFAPMAWVWSRRYFRAAVRARDLALLGYALHCAQDAVSHGTLGERHLLYLAGMGRHPDYWERAPLGIQRRIEAVTRRLLQRYG